MHKYFLTKVKYEKTSEDGKIVKVVAQNLIDALSFTEAEARIIQHMKPYISGEFEVVAISTYKVNEIFYGVGGDKWYKAKLNFITIDEVAGKEKRSSVNMLIQASSTEDANKALIKGMSGTLADYEIVSVVETKIFEVVNY